MHAIIATLAERCLGQRKGTLENALGKQNKLQIEFFIDIYMETTE
jgi:hypothetical protein